MDGKHTFSDQYSDYSYSRNIGDSFRDFGGEFITKE